MNNELFKKLTIIEYLNNKIDQALEEEPLTYTSGMELAKQENETELDYLKKNNKSYKSFIENAQSTLECIQGFNLEIMTLLHEAKKIKD